MLFGLYLLLRLAVGVATFRSCPEEEEALLRVRELACAVLCCDAGGSRYQAADAASLPVGRCAVLINISLATSLPAAGNSLFAECRREHGGAVLHAIIH